MLQIASHPVNSIHKCSTTVGTLYEYNWWVLAIKEIRLFRLLNYSIILRWLESIDMPELCHWLMSFRWTIKTNHLLLFTFQVNTEMIYYRLPHLMSGSTSNQDVSQSVIWSIPVNQSTNKRILCQWRRPGIGNRNIQWAMSIGFDFSAIPREYIDLIPTKIPPTI